MHDVPLGVLIRLCQNERGGGDEVQFLHCVPMSVRCLWLHASLPRMMVEFESRYGLNSLVKRHAVGLKKDQES